MDKKSLEKSKLLQECFYLTRLIQNHNNGRKTEGRALTRQGVNIYASSASKYQKINTNKSSANSQQPPISSNVLLVDKPPVNKIWINKAVISSDLKDSALKSEISSTQKHCMYFNPSFLKTNISELEMAGQNASMTNQNQKSLIHVNPKALIHMVYSDLQKEENCNSGSEKLVTAGSINNNNSPKKPEPVSSDIAKVTNRGYSYHSKTKLVRSPLKHQYKDTSSSSIPSRTSRPSAKLINTSSGFNRSLHSWQCNTFNAGNSVGLKTITSSPVKSFGKNVRRNSFSFRRRLSSSSSTSTAVKAAKLLRSKYKIIRTTNKKKVSSPFSIDNQADRSIRRLKKVKKYSLKYESTMPKRNMASSEVHRKKGCSSGTFHSANSSKRLFSSKGERNRKLKINRATKLQRSNNGMHSISHMSLVRIGGVLYRSSKLKLSKSIVPKEKTGANKMLEHCQTKNRTNRHRCIVHVRGNAFLMDSTGKTLQRIRKNSSKPNVEIKNPSPLKRVDIGGVTYIQKSANVLIRTNTHKARNLLSQAKQRSIAMLTSKMRKSNQTCIFYHRFGKCSKLEKGICPHIHDPRQIAVCRKFLQGSCDVKNCMLSHEVGPEKMPTCKYFLEGCCLKDSCPYLHVKVNPKAEICKNFLRGYCPEGQKCRKRHINICPDFENGKCSNGKYCPYPHKSVVVGKSRIRKKAPMNKKNPEAEKRLAQKRYYQEEDEKRDSLKLEDNAEEGLEEHKTELEKKRIKILQKVDLMKRAWQDCATSGPGENVGNQNSELASEEFAAETAMQRPKLGTLPAFIPIG